MCQNFAGKTSKRNGRGKVLQLYKQLAATWSKQIFNQTDINIIPAKFSAVWYNNIVVNRNSIQINSHT